ncbi:hypothetical protein WJX81_002234 [Elliptochloris bilobata]|uniref:Uncharacterized protein n=1 Tax=Elliptochloris bilobata TaxID=381761 RepID=A0AAW1QNA6_9CHLO
MVSEPGARAYVDTKDAPEFQHPSPDPTAAAGELDARVQELRVRLERAEAAAAAVAHAAALRSELSALQAVQSTLQAD